jgi:hypothetical protein
VYPVAHYSPGALPARRNIPDGILSTCTRRVLITRHWPENGTGMAALL